ncbi:MAG: branched-chain amino acid ABC transporter permease [Desulfarculaceae bacterium]|nr:branched-chain amino acid ABC transporter permease [Desulfarculaceae bacterium]MCF8047348.1 branched-chain amino acid ABC transporter permease [Desulfarculaceae bacterium]MCF8064778.1 branched-chain amino acid ABC transporter permease [Desulfarculaceae bacterium]MCF8096575.1 branched-chain amino acid ABC transporter permease [Desulfarculaceae bacterium]MCF8122131.1 branched-chain amino acid ABC transporter permease [Desulfarculaceae bacterium]
MRMGDFKQTYAADEAVFRSGTVRFWLVVLFLAIAAFPFMVGPYLLYMANLTGVAIIAAVGLNILTGAAGQISLGHAAFVGIGAYTSAILTTKLGLPFLLCLPLSGLSAAFFGVIVGAPSMRMKGLYLCIATLAAQVIFDFIFVHWTSVTGGIRGINVPSAELFGYKLDTEFKLYFVTIPIMIAAVTAARNLFRTRVGRAFIAIRDRDISAELMGINLFQYKLYAFAASSFYAGVAGCLQVYLLRIVTPEHFPLHESIRYLAMIIVGGLGSVLGSIFGAIFMTMVPEALQSGLALFQGLDDKLMSYLFPLQTVVFGLLIVVFLVFEPHGLAEMWRRVKNYFRLWPFEH